MWRLLLDMALLLVAFCSGVLAHHYATKELVDNAVARIDNALDGANGAARILLLRIRADLGV